MIIKIILLSLGLLISQKIDYNDAKKILLNIKEDVYYPDNEITSAIITIMEDSLITAKISCDTLIKTYREPTVLKSNVLARFFENGKAISQLRSDVAFYNQETSLKAMRNISIINLESRDSLYFIKPEESVIIWDKNYGRITSEDEFVLISNTGCTSGMAFESDVDLNNIRIVGIKGTNQQNPCNQ